MGVVFLIGIPTSQEEFSDALDDPRRDFVRLLCRSWPKYESEVVLPFERFGAIAREAAAEVIPRATLVDLIAVTDSLFDAVVLVSHWSGTTLELSDGMHSAEEIVQAVSTSFSGILDLTACRPRRLAQSLALARPSCLVKYAHESRHDHVTARLTPAIWLAFYSVLVRLRATRSLSYVEALVETARLMTDKENRDGSSRKSTS